MFVKYVLDFVIFFSGMIVVYVFEGFLVIVIIILLLIEKWMVKKKKNEWFGEEFGNIGDF